MMVGSLARLSILAVAISAATVGCVPLRVDKGGGVGVLGHAGLAFGSAGQNEVLANVFKTGNRWTYTYNMFDASGASLVKIDFPLQVNEVRDNEAVMVATYGGRPLVTRVKLTQANWLDAMRTLVVTNPTAMNVDYVADVEVKAGKFQCTVSEGKARVGAEDWHVVVWSSGTAGIVKVMRTLSNGTASSKGDGMFALDGLAPLPAHNHVIELASFERR